MILRRIYEDHLAQASYLVGCAASGEAIVIDPSRNIDQYLETAKAEGLRIVEVTETHIHADFVSGARALAARAGARLSVSGEGGEEWRYAFENEPNVRVLRNGDTIEFGKLRFEAVHTPGHTPEHLSFLLTDLAASPDVYAAFTGDFIFAGDVGRPDLLERAAGYSGAMEPAARTLWASLQQFATYPDHLLIWPGHGAGSACGKSLSGIPVTTLGYEKRSNWAFGMKTEDAFVAAVLEGQPEPPRYFAEMKRVNKLGLDVPPATAPQPIEFAAIDPAAWILDLRRGKHVAEGAVSIPLQKQFLTWAGSIVPVGSPIAFVAEGTAQAAQAARLLTLIGYDKVVGYTTAPVEGTPARRVDPEQLFESMMKGHTLIDVRGAAERAHGAIPGSVHIPLGDLLTAARTIDHHAPLIVHCQGGARSAIAASLLRKLGFERVGDLSGGYLAWSKTPVCAAAR